MDPRVAWIQPEQKGPANALWMQVWETSQGVRLFSPHNHNHCVELLNNVAASERRRRSGGGGGGGHHIAVSSRGQPLSAGNSNHPRAGDGQASFSSSSSSSSSRESDSPALESVAGNVNQHPGAGVHLGPGDSSVDNNRVNLHHRHPQQQPPLPAFTFQPVWMSRGQHAQQPVPVPVTHTHTHSHHPGRRKSDNKASTYGMNYLLSNCTHVNCASAWTPWKGRAYSPGVLG